MSGSFQTNARQEGILAILLFMLTAGLTYYRLFIGVSVGDEAFFPMIATFPLIGGEWFVREQSIQQMSGILTSPFAMTYKFFFGSTGIMLFFRHLHWLLSLGVALNFFQYLRNHIRWPVALVLAMSAMAFVPNSIASLNYNSQGSLFFGLATLLACRAVDEKRKLLAAASGVAWVFCVYSYPMMIAGFVVFSLAAAVLTLSKPQTRQTFAIPFAGGVLGSSLILGGHLLYIGIDNIRSSLEFSALFASPGAFWKIPFSLNLIANYLPPRWLTLAVLAVWIIGGFRNANFSAGGCILFLATYIFFGINYEGNPSQILWPVLEFLLIIFLVHRRLHLDNDERNLLWLVVLPAIAASIAACLASRMTVYATCLSGLFGGLAIVVLMTWRQPWMAWLASLLITGNSLYYYLQSAYEDDRVSELTYQIEGGPWAGLFTFPAKGRFLEELQADLHSLEPNLKGKTILYKDLFPGGYLMTDNNPPGGPTTYIAPALFYMPQRPIYNHIYSDPQNRPDVVVELIYYPATMNQNWFYNVPEQNPYNDPFHDFFIKTGEYEIILNRNAYRVLARKS